MGDFAATGVPFGGAQATIKTSSAVTTTARNHFPLTALRKFANRKSKGRERRFS